MVGTIAVLIGLLLARAGYAGGRLDRRARRRRARRRRGRAADAPQRRRADGRHAGGGRGDRARGDRRRRADDRAAPRCACAQAAGRNFVEVAVACRPTRRSGRATRSPTPSRTPCARALPGSDVVVHVEPRRGRRRPARARQRRGAHRPRRARGPQRARRRRRRPARAVAAPQAAGRPATSAPRTTSPSAVEAAIRAACRRSSTSTRTSSRSRPRRGAEPQRAEVAAEERDRARRSSASSPAAAEALRFRAGDDGLVVLLPCACGRQTLDEAHARRQRARAPDPRSGAGDRRGHRPHRAAKPEGSAPSALLGSERWHAPAQVDRGRGRRRRAKSAA